MPPKADSELDNVQEPLVGAVAQGKGASQRAAKTANTEFELKLLVSPAQLAVLEDAPVVTAHARNKGTVRQIRSVYFDTSNYDLHRAGIALRVRQNGRHFLQTVKMSPSRDGNLLQRGEWECPVPSPSPKLDALATILPADLLRHLEPALLQPVFSTDVRRHRRLLVLPSGEVEIAFDQGRIEVGDKIGLICEIELELKRGEAAVFYDLALRLSELATLRPSIYSKAERGFALCLGTPPAVPKAPKLRLAKDVSLDDAFTRILEANLHHLFASQPAAEDGRDPEGVHQVRVALRRLRSALALLSKLSPSKSLEGFRADAKWLASSLNDARNWDVFLLSTVPTIAKACPTVAGFDILQSMVEPYRASAYDKARSTLATPRSCTFQIALGGWIGHRGWRHDVSATELAVLVEPASHVAPRILTPLHQKVIKQGRHFKTLKREELHQLRLKLKKLRYAADFFLPLFANKRATRRYARQLAQLQDYLGTYNDMAITAELMTVLTTDGERPAIERAIGAVAGWLARDRVGHESDLQRAWRKFRKSAPPWPISQERIGKVEART
jgi:inorganic triphosphatase YgiF